MLKVLGTIKRSFQILHQQIPVDPNSGEASAMGSLKKTMYDIVNVLWTPIQCGAKTPSLHFFIKLL